MKPCIPLFLLNFLLCTAAVAQGINYQAVARDGDGALLTEQTLTVHFAVYPQDSDRAAYEEQHQTTTDAFGQFAVVLGRGDALTSAFDAIDWTSGQHEMGVRIDAGEGPVDLGRLPLQGVPYSFYAARAGSAEMSLAELSDVEGNTPAPGQTLKWNGAAWAPVR